jgi:flagellin
MGLRINTNVLSINAQRNLSSTTRSLSRALERLSSGSRINRAGDDAAGLAISEGLQSQVRGLKVAVRNTNDAVGFLNTAEGALGEITNITQRIRELAIQAANGTLSVTDRNYLESEKDALIEEFNRIASQTQFNGVTLLDGSFQTTNLQVGVNKGETIAFRIGDARASSMGALATVSGAQGVMAPYASFSLSINGIAVDTPSSSDDSKSTMNKQYSAIALASQINEKTSLTNVKAEVQTNTVTIWNTKFSTGSYSTDSNFQINDVTISGSGLNTAQKFVDAVNSFSNSTGVKARLKDGSTDDVELYAEDGRNIEVQVSGYSAGGFSSGATTTFLAVLLNDSANFGASATSGILSGSYTGGTSLSTQVSNLAAVSGTISFVRTGAIRLISSTDINISGPTDTAILGFSSGAYAVNANSAINQVDLSSQSGAAEAINVADAALKQITNLRASLGAVQNRLESTSNNIGVMLENISAARSQIRDADIAEETAELTRSQILQQAGVAVLGQANSASQIALSLLRF